MDFTSPLKSEIFRPLTTTVIPGAVAVSPFIVVLGYYVPAVAKFWDAHASAFVAILLIAILAAGLILENVGGFIELQWDEIIEKRHPGHKANWEKYLKLRMQDEIVGQRYLRSVVLRMKFELSMAPALVIFAVGLVWIDQLYKLWSTSALVSLTVVVLIVAGYLLYESYDSASALGRIRIYILKAMNALEDTEESA